ncbi:MAG: hypothetical protein ABL958_08160 [Bdellovibrionia bacterium]
MKRAILLLSLALSLVSFSQAQAQDLNYENDFAASEVMTPDTSSDMELYQRFGREMYLGQVYLGITRSQVQLNTRTCAQNARGRVEAIRFHVVNAGAEIDSIMVQFGNGQWDSFNLGHRHFRPGQSSQWLNLRGNDRCVRRIVIVGDTDNEFFFTRAVVRLWAR